VVGQTNPCGRVDVFSRPGRIILQSGRFMLSHRQLDRVIGQVDLTVVLRFYM
jgi:hypothetical protein